MNVVLFRDLPDGEVASLRNEFRNVLFKQTTDRAELETWLQSAEAVFGNIPAELALQAPRLRWLQIVSSGIDEYTLLRGSPVTVTTAHGIHAKAIAEHVLMSVMWFARGMPYFNEAQRSQRWDRKPSVPRSIEGQTIGLVGCGAVGREIARWAKPLGFRTIATKRTVTQKLAEVDEVLAWSQLDELLARSDHVVISVPLTSVTRGLFDRIRLSRLKPNAVLHNIARGGLVDEAALFEQLRTNRLAGAALDVFEKEPLTSDSPFWALSNVLVTPHIAGHHRDLGQLVLGRFRENLQRLERGEPLSPVADFDRGY